MNSLLGDVMSTLTEQMGIDMKAELQSSPGVMNDMKQLMAANMGDQQPPFTCHPRTIKITALLYKAAMSLT